MVKALGAQQRNMQVWLEQWAALQKIQLEQHHERTRELVQEVVHREIGSLTAVQDLPKLIERSDADRKQAQKKLLERLDGFSVAELRDQLLVDIEHVLDNRPPSQPGGPPRPPAPPPAAGLHLAAASEARALLPGKVPDVAEDGDPNQRFASIVSVPSSMQAQRLSASSKVSPEDPSLKGPTHRIMEYAAVLTDRINDFSTGDTVEGLKAALGLQSENFQTSAAFELFADVSARCPRRLRCDRVKRLVDSVWFDLLVVLIILANSVLVGVEADMSMGHQIDRHQGAGTELAVPVWFATCKVAVVLLFTVEMLLRLGAGECQFFVGQAWMWNWLDVVLLLCAWMSLAVKEIGVSTLHVRMFRVLRLNNLLRLFKGSTAVRELRYVLSAVSESLAPLVLIVLLIALITYTFAVVVMSDVAGHLDGMAPHSHGELVKALESSFGSLPAALLSLVGTLFGGTWFEVGGPLLKVSPLSAVLLGVYGGFMILGVLNVITGIFVQSVDRAALLDHQKVILLEMDTENSRANRVRALLLSDNAESAETGFVTLEQFRGHAKSSAVQSFLAFFDITLIEACGMFKILDHDGNGQVHVDEFLLDCMRLKGPSKAVDVCTLMAENKRLAENFAAHFSATMKTIDRLERRLEQAMAARRPWGADRDDRAGPGGPRRPAETGDAAEEPAGEEDAGADLE